MPEQAIVLRDVSKRFGQHRALTAIEFAVPAGQVVGLIGPNGSGKTTLLRIISGFLDPDEGTVEVAGHSVRDARMYVRTQLGYMTENVPLYRDMRVTEYLSMRARLRGVARTEVATCVARVSERCHLRDVKRRLIGQLSKGYRQRVGLADALLCQPPILLLDEPTSGLDPLQVREFRALINELAGTHTIVISSHVLPELQVVADRVLVLSGGRLVGAGTLTELRARCGLDADRSLEDVFVALSEMEHSG